MSWYCINDSSFPLPKSAGPRPCNAFQARKTNKREQKKGNPASGAASYDIPIDNNDMKLVLLLCLLAP